MAVSQALSVTETSYSVENNTSVVRIRWTSTQTGESWSGYTRTAYYYVSINGGAETRYSVSYTLPKASTKTIVDTSITVPHNADGTGTVTVRTWMDTEISAGVVQKSSTLTLTTIPRATTPIVSGTLSLGSTITISTTGRASTSFTHNIYYSWGTQVIDAVIASGVGSANTSFTIPKTLAEYVMGGTSGMLVIKCVTYNGSTVIGTKTLYLTVSIPNTAEFQPNVNSIAVEEAATVPVARYVKGYSQLKITVNATGAYVTGSSNRNSFIASATVTVDGVTYTKTLGQNAAATWDITTNTLVSAGTKTISVTVKDSRGRTKTSTQTVEVYDYATPVISSFTAQRCLANGTVSDSGGYVLFNLTASVASVNNTNAKTYKIVYESNGSEIAVKSGTLSAYTNATVTLNSYSANVAFSVDYSWTVRCYVYDSFNSAHPSVATVSVPTEATFFDWRTNGKGWAFGKVSTKDGLEIGWEMFDRFDTYIRNGLAVYTGSGASAIDPDVTLEHLFLTDKNTPTAGFWYIENIFYSTKSETANRTQIAFPYDKKGSFYIRYYYSGAWSAWSAADAPVTVSTGEAYGHMIFADGRKVCWGKVGITPTAANTVTSVTINFPVTFTKAPNITAMPHTSVPNVISFGVGAGTAVSDALSKMVIYMTRTNTVTTSFFWRAEGY